MRDEIEFERLLDSVLHESANAVLPDGFDARMLAAVREAVPSPATEALTFARGVSSESLLRSLWNGVRDLLSPPSLPPLVLQSRPVAVADRMVDDGGYSSTAYAVAVHAMAVFLIGFVVRAQIREITPAAREPVSLVVPVLHVTARAAALPGGGGGHAGAAPLSRGRLPRFAEQQLVPPSAPPLEPPKIAMMPAIEMQQVRLADNAMPNVGLPSSPLAGVSMGDGRGTGMGSGEGAGVGPGSGGLSGGGLRHVGGGVSKPEVLFQPEPEFSEEARRAKVSGNVMVYLRVDPQGRPSHLRVVQGIGYGLDEKALEAVRQYRFKPAMENGRPVPVEMYVEVDFHLL